MHIMEGFLPWYWCLFWYLLALPFVVMGVIRLRSFLRTDREYLPLVAICGAFIFILSSLKLPSVTGSCSHPTGTGLSVIGFGVSVTSVVGGIVLLFQALFLAHGGLSTLGANLDSMAIGGPIAGYALYRLLRNTPVNIFFTVFLVSAVADFVTYIITSLQLALAYPAQVGGVAASFAVFLTIFAVTQVPLSILEGILLALVFKYIIQVKPDIIVRLGVFSGKQIAEARMAPEPVSTVQART